MMYKIRLLKAFKGFPVGTEVWAKPVTNVGLLHTIWQTPSIKVYLGCAHIDDGFFEVIEGVPPVYPVYEPTKQRK